MCGFVRPVSTQETDMLDTAFIETDDGFEVIDHKTEWVWDYSADIGGYDGYQPVCTITKAKVFSADGDEYEVDRDYLITVFGLEAVWDSEETLAEEVE